MIIPSLKHISIAVINRNVLLNWTKLRCLVYLNSCLVNYKVQLKYNNIFKYPNGTVHFKTV